MSQAAGGSGGRGGTGGAGSNLRTLAILVPVKELSQAKTRLAPLLSLPERRELARLMLDGVLRALAQAQAPAESGVRLRRVVVTSYAPAMALARELGYTVLEEAQQVSESASVDAASAALAREGVAGVLRVPLDLPLLTAAHVAPLLRAIVTGGAGARAVLVPSRDRRGTNALYRAPPTLFASQFGPDSLVLHERAARAVTADVQMLPLEGFALDVDDPDDVAALLEAAGPGAASPSAMPCPPLDYLRSLDVPARLAAAKIASNAEPRRE